MIRTPQIRDGAPGLATGVLTEAALTDATEGENMVREYFSTIGLDLSTNLGKSVFLNPRTRLLTIRATAQDLDTIRRKIPAIKPPSPDDTSIDGLLQAGRYLYEVGRYDEAEAKFKQVMSQAPLTYAPSRSNNTNNTDALNHWAQEYITLLQERRTTAPETTHSNALEVMPQSSVGIAVDVAELVQDGRNLYETGHYDEAEVRFNQVLAQDHQNLPAAHYLELIQEKRALELAILYSNTVQQVSGKLLMSSPYSRQSNVVNTSPGRKLIFDQLGRIRVESLDYRDLPLKDVLDDLAAKAKARDPDGKGINFFFSHEASAPFNNPTVDANGNLVGATDANQPDATSAIVHVSLQNVTLDQALDAILKTANPTVKYSVLDYGIMFSLRGNEPVPLEIRSFKVDRDTFLTNVLSMTGASSVDGMSEDQSASVDIITVSGNGINHNGGFGGGPNETTNYGSIPFVPSVTRGSRVEQQVRAFFGSIGIDLSTNSGKAVIWNDRKGMLTIRATAEDLDLIENTLQVMNAPSGATGGTLNNVPAAPRNPTTASANANRPAIFARLDQIRVDANYSGMLLQDVLDDLHRRTQAADPAGQGINFVFNRADPNPASADGAPVTVRLALRDVPVNQVLGAIAGGSSRPVGYSVMDYAVVFSLAPTNQPPELQVRNFVVNNGRFAVALRDATGTDLASGREPVEAAVRKYFAAKGIDLSTNTSKAVIWNGPKEMLTIRATAEDLDLIEKMLQVVNAAPAGSAGRSNGPATRVMGGFARASNVVTTSPGRKLVFDKLNRIPIESLNYADLPLEDVLDDLSAKVLARDPDGKGVNFFFSSATPSSFNNPTVDENGNLVPSKEPPATTVKINLALKNATLSEALDGILKTANQPIKYSVLDYGIVFSIRGNEPLEIRNFQVDRNAFSNGLPGVTGNSSTGFRWSLGRAFNGFGDPADPTFAGGGLVEDQVRAFFYGHGVDLSTNNGKAVIWNERRGMLTIKATADDLDVIEKALQVVNTVQPEVNIKVKFVEITQNDTRTFGFPWQPGITVLPGSATNSTVTNAPPLGFFPGAMNVPPGGTVTPTAVVTVVAPPAPNGPPPSGYQWQLGGVAPGPGTASNAAAPNQQNAPRLATITGILTSQQYATVLQALQQRTGTEILTAPEVTTESGRQAQMRAVDVKQIVTFAGTTTGPTVPAFNPQTNTVSLGPELDVVPYITADQNAVQMALIPSITEFVGYTNSGQFVPQVLPLPHFRLRQVVTSVTVWDGQTVVLGGGLSTETNRVVDKVPLLGDLPVIGRLFRSASTLPLKKNLMIFVTVTLVNPDGTRFHSDEELDKLRAAPPPPTRQGTNE